MNWPSARSSRASPPLSTTKREPDSFAAVSKSIRPSASPISKCCLALSRFRGVAEAVALHVAVSRRRRPARPSFGHVRDGGESLVQSLSRRRAPPPPARGIAFLQPRDLGHQLLRPRLVLLRPWPGRSPWRGHCGAPWRPAGRRWRSCGGRRGRSGAADRGSMPRFRRPWSKAAGFSRMERMSCMGSGPASSARPCPYDTTAPSTMPRMAADREALGPTPSAARAASASARFLSTMRTEKMDAS